MQLQSSWARRTALALAVAVAVVTIMVGGCTTETTWPTPSASVEATLATLTTSATPSTGPTDVPTDPNATPPPTLPTQTDTEWGRIWDDIPPSFPTYPGAAPTEAGEGPASAVLDVGDVEPAEVAGYYVPAVESLGYSTVSRSDPREDGSIEIEWAGETTCRIQATITPLGGSTIVTILYGAGCPFV
jgi:hypothetical protein